jgi:hypothetical protein
MRSILTKLIGLSMALTMNAYAQVAPGQAANSGAPSIAGTVEQVDIANRTLLVNGQVFAIAATASVNGLVASNGSGLRAIQAGMNVRVMLEASDDGATPGRITSIMIIPD